MDTLPVELIYRVFDYLDAPTILLSLRPLCRPFLTIVQTYNRYSLNMFGISRRKYFLLCRLIEPSKVISLTLSNDERTSDQIERFLSTFSLKQFIRLRSLNLLQIYPNQLEKILTNIQFHLLRSFSCQIQYQHFNDQANEIKSLSSFLSQSSLRELHLTIPSHVALSMSWPIHSTIQCLTLHTHLTINQLKQIFQSSPHLKTLSLDGIPLINSTDKFIFHQLKCLTIDKVDTNIHYVEMFLLFTPFLTFLQLCGGTNMIDGKRWQTFIQLNLRHLSKFQFFFTSTKSVEQTHEDIHQIINTFQTSFWIQNISCFVTCESSKTNPTIVYLSSLPYCKSSLFYQSPSDNISLSTTSTMINNINSLSINLNSSMANHLLQKIPKKPFFPKVTKFKMEICEDWPILSLHSLIILIDIDQIVELTLSGIVPKRWNEHFWMDLCSFFSQLHHLSSLTILFSIDHQIYLNLPRQIEHLQMTIDDHNQIPLILQRCSLLSTIQFCNLDYSLIKEILHYFSSETLHSTCLQGYRTVSVWIGKINLYLQQ